MPNNILQAITSRGGHFLEAPVSGSKKPAEDGQLVILAAGEKVKIHTHKSMVLAKDLENWKIIYIYIYIYLVFKGVMSTYWRHLLILCTLG